LTEEPTWDVGPEALRAAAAVAWLAEEAARRVEGTSFVHDQARAWNEGQIDELAVVSKAFVALEEAVDRLQAFMPSWTLEGTPGEDWDVDHNGRVRPSNHDDPDPVRYTGSEGWDFSMWMATKMSPMKSALDSATMMWQMLLQQGPTFYSEHLGKTYEVRPEVTGGLHGVASYAARIAEMLMDGRVEGRLGPES